MLKSGVEKIKNFLRYRIFGTDLSRNDDQVATLKIKDLNDIKEFFPRQKFFIFGHARSGTTLLARLIRLHPEVHCNWQAHFFTRQPVLQDLVNSPEIRGWLDAKSNRWNQGERLSPLVLRAAADFMMERQAVDLGKSIVGDKSPNSQLKGQAVQYLHDIYPDAKLIFIVRDGRDVVLSHRFQAFIDFPEFLSASDLQIRDDFAVNEDPFYQGERSIFTKEWLLQDIQSWRDNLQETDHEAVRLFGDQYRTLRYEDLISEPEDTLRTLWKFLEVKAPALPGSSVIDQEMNRNPDEDWQKEQDLEIFSGLEKGKAGSWRDLFTGRDRKLFKELAGQTLIDWHYEKDLDW